MTRLATLVALLGVYAAVRVSLSLLTAHKRLAEAQALSARFRARIDANLAAMSWGDLGLPDHERLWLRSKRIDPDRLFVDAAHKPEAI